MMGVIAAEEAISVQTSQLSQQIVNAVSEMMTEEVGTALTDEVGTAVADEIITALTDEAVTAFTAEVTTVLAEEVTTALAEEVTTALAEVGMESLFNEIAVLAGAAVLDEAIGGMMGYLHITYSAYRGISKEGTGKKALVRTALILISGIIGGFLGSTLGGYAAEYIETNLYQGFLFGYGLTFLSVCGAVLGKVSGIICSNVLVDKYLR